MRPLRLRERLEPVGDLVEALVARGLRHARIHVRVLVRLARDRGLQVLAARADRQVRRRVADLREIVEVAVRMARLAFGGRAEQRSDVVLAFDVRLVCEVEVAAVRLRFAGKRGLQVVVGLRAFEILHAALLVMDVPWYRCKSQDAPRYPDFAPSTRGRLIDYANARDSAGSIAQVAAPRSDEALRDGRQRGPSRGDCDSTRCGSSARRMSVSVARIAAEVRACNRPSPHSERSEEPAVCNRLISLGRQVPRCASE